MTASFGPNPLPCLLFALDRESVVWRRRCGRGQACGGAPCRAWVHSLSEAAAKILVVETGVGAERTRVALEWIRSQVKPSFLIMAGYAGSLAENLRIGDVVLAREVIDPEGHLWPTTWPALAESMPWPRVRLLTSPRLIGDPEEKRRLGQAHQAQAVDMEAATVARFCTEQQILFGCVRVMSDAIDTPLSLSLLALLAGGQVSTPRLLKALLRKPTLVIELLALARHTRLASHNLAAALMELLNRSTGSLACP